MSGERQELKPCPFCGGEATATDHVQLSWLVTCDNNDCLAQPEVFAGSEAAAYDAWNRRPLEDAHVAALRSAREDSARLDWIEAHGQQASLHCWNVMPHSHVGHDNGWTLGSDEELDDIGRGRTARMAIDDAMRHPERLLVSLPQPERDDDGA